MLCILRTGDAIEPVAQARGQFADFIRNVASGEWDERWLEVDARATHALPSSSELSGVIITGSPSSVTERAPWMLRTEECIRQWVSAGVPIFGICFGHQIVAQALGGQVARSPRGREMGTVSVEFLDDDPMLEGIPDTIDAQATHVDSVVRLPKGARVLARTALEPVAMYAWGDHVRCVQFHPEFDEEIMLSYINARTPILLNEGFDPTTLARTVRQAPLATRLLVNFIRVVVMSRCERPRYKTGT